MNLAWALAVRAMLASEYAMRYIPKQRVGGTFAGVPRII
jgi:hypothetical protein